MARSRASRRALAGFVAASFLFTSIVPPGAYAQPAGLPDDMAAVAAGCDLTGQWRTSRGPMQLVHAPLPQMTGGVVGGADAAGPADGDGAVAGSLRTAEGEVRLDGAVSGGRVEFRWYVAVEEGEAVPGAAWLAVGDDCATLTGGFTVASGEEPWIAHRIVAAAGTDAMPDALLDKLAQIDEGMAAIQALRDSLPRDEIDVGARAARLPASPEAIHAHVHDTIAFEAYQGVLRGARGALVSGAGNAADQSLLLAALLAEHGFETRFATGTLDEATAARLVDGMGPPAPPMALAAPGPEVTARLIAVAGIEGAQFDEAVASRQAARDALLAAVADDVAGYGEQIASLLGEQGLTLAVDPAAERAELIARTREHVWVQVAVDGGWLDLDPLADAPGVALAVTEATHETLPEDMFHLVRFRVTVERLEEGQLATEEVAGWRIRMADLASLGFPGIWIGNLPLNGPEAMAAQAALEDIGSYAAAQGPERMLAATQFQPLLALSTGERQAGTGFDLTGRRVPDDWRMAAAAGIAEGVATGLGGATGALESLFGDPEETANPAEPPVLTAQWIDFEIVGPGYGVRSERRFVVDRLGPAARAAGIDALPEDAPDDDAVRLGLAGVSEILVTTGVVSEALAFDTMLANYMRNQETLQRLAELAAGAAVVDGGFYGAYAPYPNKLMIHALLQQEQARLVAAATGVHAYSAEPAMVARHVIMRRDSYGGFGAGQAIDLLHVRLQAAAVAGVPAEAVARFQRDYGTALTSLEHHMLRWIGRAECPQCGEQTVIGTTTVMEQANAAGVAMAVLAPGMAEAIPAALAADDRARIAAALEAGYWVIVPEAPVEIAGTPASAWWRIDPATGATLGMTQHGGADFTEYVAFVIVLGWPFILGTTMGVLGCTGISGDSIGGGKLFACVICGLITGICLELAWLATNFVGAIAATSTCGLGSSTAGVVVCGIGGML